MLYKSIIGAMCACLVVVSFSANAALIGRDLDGNLSTAEAYYDDVADLTWLADANAALGSGYDVTYGDGRMTWGNANAWAAGLDVAGVTGWRLPNTIDVGGDGATVGVDYGYSITTHSEMSNMYYNVLGNTAGFPSLGGGNQPYGCYVDPTYCLNNTGPFSNLQPLGYWSATEYGLLAGNAWIFNMGGGLQSYNSGQLYAWAVHDGDVGASVIPIPPAVWLFSSGLIGLIGLARRKVRA